MMAKRVLFSTLWAVLAAFLTGGCMGMQSKKAEALTVRGISGSSLELSWVGTKEGDRTRVLVTDTQSRDVLQNVQLDVGIGSIWITDLEAGEYEFQEIESTPQGLKTLGKQNIKVKSEKSSRLLTPEDFGLAQEDRLGLTTLIAVPRVSTGEEVTQNAFRTARAELMVVSRTLVEFFMGSAYCLDREDQIGTIEQIREYLRSTFKDLELTQGFAANALLAVDLRLPEPEKEIPCQLSLRLFEITHPEYAAETLWNQRPMIYENFIEVPDFQVGKSNYEPLIKAFREGMVSLCNDPVVKSYCDIVTVDNSREPEFYRHLWEFIGRSVPDEDGGDRLSARAGGVDYRNVEEMLFPAEEVVFKETPPAVKQEEKLEESLPPVAESEPAPPTEPETETVEEPDPASKTEVEEAPPPEAVESTEATATEPVKETGDSEEGKEILPAPDEPKVEEEPQAVPEEKQKAPGKNPFFKPKKEPKDDKAEGTKEGDENVKKAEDKKKQPDTPDS
ncbi:MAG: hypothetical protein KJ645_02820 [Planctomycetes bacterium]|nr:hypothetical protein [Planctomycetota bacterium]